MSRRRVVRGLLAGAAGLAGAGLVGCDSDDEPSTQPPLVEATVTEVAPAKLRRGGTFRDGGLGFVGGVDPHSSLYHGSSIVRNAYVSLVRGEMLRPDVGLHRDLAEAHELVDETTYVFRLRENAMIHPNDLGIPERPMDAEDVLASFDRIGHPASGANGLPFFTSWVESYEAPRTDTVRITTRGPYAWMLSMLGDSLQSMIVPREFLALSPTAFAETAVGAGPFMVDEVSEGRGFRVRRHEQFYDRERPFLDAHRRVIFQDPVTLRAAFQDRQVDLWVTPNVEEARDVTQQVNGVVHVEHDSVGYNSFWMRVDTEPWNDERVRRAMSRAMDRGEYVELIGRGAGRPMGPLSPAFGAYALPGEELAELQPHDPDEARALFEAAGVREVEFTYPASEGVPDYVEIMTRQLQAVGVTARPEPLDVGAWLMGYGQNRFTATLAINQSYKTPEHALLWYRSGGPTGAGRYATGHYWEALDGLLDAAASTVEEEERIELYQEAQREILASDPAFINVFNLRMNTLHYDNVHGLSPGPGHMGEFLYRQVWIDA